MNIRFYKDPETGLPYIYEHGVTDEEVRHVLGKSGSVIQGDRDSMIKMGQTAAGRYIQVIYSPDQEGDGIFVITAYQLAGKALKAYRRRQRRKQR